MNFKDIGEFGVDGHRGAGLLRQAREQFRVFSHKILSSSDKTRLCSRWPSQIFDEGKHGLLFALRQLRYEFQHCGRWHVHSHSRLHHSPGRETYTEVRCNQAPLLPRPHDLRRRTSPVPRRHTPPGWRRGKVEKQHAAGKLTARERIAAAIDKSAPFLEIGLLVAYDQYDGRRPARRGDRSRRESKAVPP